MGNLNDVLRNYFTQGITKHTKETMLYILGVVVAIAGFVNIFISSPIAGLAFMWLGIAIIPKVSIRFGQLVPSLNGRGKYVIFIVLLLSGIIAGVPNKSTPVASVKQSDQSSTSNENVVRYDANGNQLSKGQPTTSEESYVPKTIRGIKAVDVYLNFEKLGYTTKKDISTLNALFTNTSTENGIHYEVVTYCAKGVDDITSIALTAQRIYPEDNSIDDMKAFLKYGCSIPYDGADAQKVASFIDANYYTNKASITISGVKFTIYTPTAFARMIDIQRE